MKDTLFSLMVDRVTGIAAALVADDDFVFVGEQVDELALGFVAPLQTDDAGNAHLEASQADGKARPQPGATGRGKAPQTKPTSLSAPAVGGQGGEGQGSVLTVCCCRALPAGPVLCPDLGEVGHE